MYNHKEYQKKYRQTEEHKESQKKYMKKYKQTEKYKESQKKYQQTTKCKETLKKYHQTKKYKDYQKKYMKKYEQTAKYKEYQKKYEQTERSKFVHAQKSAMRRNLGFVLITDDIPDEPYAFHHINHNLVAAIPSDLHEALYKQNLTAHRFYCYQIIKQLYRNN